MQSRDALKKNNTINALSRKRGPGDELQPPDLGSFDLIFSRCRFGKPGRTPAIRKYQHNCCHEPAY